MKTLHPVPPQSIFRILALLCLLAVPASSPAALIGYWNFDENAGTVAADTSGRVGPLNGTLSAASGGIIPAWTPGRFGSGLNFNFASLTAGGLVTVPFNADLLQSGAFTVSYWWRPDYLPAASTFPGIVRLGNQTTVPPAGWGFYRSSPNQPVYKRGNHQPAVYAAMTVGNWHHIALTHDGAGNNIAFMNGTMVNFVTNWPNIASTAVLEFGRMDSFDDAGLDDAALFNETISLAKVRSLYTVPTSIFLDYNLAKMRSLWAIFDGGPGASGVVDGTTWNYTNSLPGSTTLGDAYLSGSRWFVVLGAGVGVSATAILLGDISPAGIGPVGTQTYTETPAIGASARFVFDLGATTTIGGGVNDLIEITGDLNVSGNTIVIDPIAPLANGTYRLFNYSGTKSGSFNATILHNSRYTMTLDQATAGQINVTVSGANGDVRWFSTSSGLWDFTTLNWSNTVALATSRFFQGDSITFAEGAAFQPAISLTAPMFPSAMTVNSAAINYSLSGSPLGGLAGGLTKQGASLLSMGSAVNTFHGPVTVSGGTLRIGSTASLGTTNSGTTVASGATLDLAGFALLGEGVTVGGPGLNNTGAVINTGASLVNDGLRNSLVTLTADTTFGGVNRWDVFGGTLVGNGFKLTKTGAPEIALSNLRNTGLGDIEVQRGQLTILGSTTMGDPAKPVVVRSNATFAHWASGTNIHNKPLVMEFARLLNGTSPADIATNVAAVSLTGSNTADGASSVVLLGTVSGSGSLTKIGTGTLALGGTNAYTGNTAVNAGTVALVGSGSITSSPNITIASGAVLDSTARTDGTLTLVSGQTLSGVGTVRGSLAAGTGVNIGAGTSPGTLTVTNALNLTGGATLTYELSAATTPGGGTNDLINVGGALNLSGATTLKVLPIGNLTIGSPYTLMNYSGALSGGAPNFTVVSDSRAAFAVSTATAGKVLLTASGMPLLIEWVGGLAPLTTTWDTRNSGNWLGAVFGDQFYAGDTVVFTDFASEFNVTLVGELYPAGVSVEADVSDYLFTGPGRIRGGALSKTLAGKLILANSGINDYPGPTIIASGGGTLQVGSGGTAGNLGPAPVTVDATLAFNRSDDITLVNTVTGVGTVRKDGNNQLFLGASMAAFNGTIAATAGTLRPTVATGLGTATGGTAVSGGATLEINGLNLGVEPVTASGAGVNGNGAIIDTGAAQNNALQFLTLSGNTTLGGVNRWDVRANPGGSLLGNGFSLTKTGANQISFVSLGDSGLGDINVQQGLLSIEGTTGLGLPGGTVTVSTGATLMLWGNTVSQAKNFALNGAARLFKDNGAATITGTGTLTGSNAVEAANNTGTDFTFSGAIGGSGSLNKLGAGNVFLTANNNYSGGTRVSAGNLLLGNGGTAGSVAGNIQVDTSLYFYRSDSFTLANNITGTGAGTVFLRTAGGMILDGTAQINLSSGGSIEVGRDFYGKLIIRSGANPVIGRMLLGNIANTPGDVVQEGGNVWVTLEARVGHWPTETSTYLLGGGTLNLTNVPTGVVNPAGTPEQNGVLYLGIDGTGIFTQTGGVATAHGIVLDGRGTTAGTDTFNLEGGTFNLGASGFKSGNLDANATYLINLGGGTLTAISNWSSSRLITLTGTNGDVTFNTAGNTVTLSGVLSGVGGLRKSGTGILRLSATNTYTGTTLVNGGTLDGNGILAGPLVVVAGGTVAPGTSVGILTVNNTVSLSGTAVMEISKTAGIRTNDLISGASRITYGGTLNVLASGEALVDGDTFRLFGATNYSGSFATVNLPPLGPGLVWDLNQLLINGTVRVTDNLPPVPGPATISTIRNRAVTYAVFKIVDLASDPEGNPITFTSVLSTSTNGAAVSLSAGRITYTPVTDFIGADRFSYVLSDNQGGQSLGQVEVLVYPGNVAGMNIVSLIPLGGAFQFTFAGIPGRTYGIERAASVNGPWTQIASVVCDALGLTTYLDTNPPPGVGFYRTTDLSAP